MTAPRLTIILVLKGRHAFTLRFLWHANKARLPYRFLIADGQVHPDIARLLENPRVIFPNLDIEYVRYPDDADLSRFFAKVDDALRHVRTPYAMMACNDDFIGFAGVERSLDFLDANADYVCASGRIGGFSVYSGLNNGGGGLIGRLNRLYMYYRHQSVSSPSAFERLRQGAFLLWPYYSIYRTATLATIRHDIAQINFSDLVLHETYQVMRALCLGKAHVDAASVSYFRQFGTSTSAGANRNWARHLVRSRFTSDVQAMAEHLSAAVGEGEDSEMTQLVLSVLEAKFARFFQANYGSLQEVKQFLRERAPMLVAWAKNRPRAFIGRERSAMRRQLIEGGASETDITRFGADFAAIEDVFSGKTFRDFVQPYLATLCPDVVAHRPVPHRLPT